MRPRLLADCRTCDGRGAVRSKVVDSSGTTRRTTAGLCGECGGTGGHLTWRARLAGAR